MCVYIYISQNNLVLELDIADVEFCLELSISNFEFMQTFQNKIKLSDKLCIEIDIANVEFHLELDISKIDTKIKGNLLDTLKN